MLIKIFRKSNFFRDKLEKICHNIISINNYYYLDLNL